MTLINNPIGFAVNLDYTTDAAGHFIDLVVGASATHFSVTTSPSSPTSGVAFTTTVTALDAFGNVALGYLGTVGFTKTDVGAGSSVPANYTFQATDAGVHTFLNSLSPSATFVTSGNQTLTVTDTVTGSIVGSATVVVVASAATSLTVASFPTTTTACVVQTFTVTAKDTFGNIATGYRGSVALTSTDHQAVFALPGTPYTFTATDNGVHTFNGTLETAATQSITANDGSLPAASETGILVNPTTASTFTVTGYPATIAGGGTWFHGHGQGSVRQRRHRLPRYGGSHQQRRPGRLCSNDVRLHGHRRRRPRLQRPIALPEDLGHAVHHGNRYLHPRHRRQSDRHRRHRGDGGQPDRQRVSFGHHGGRAAQLHGHGQGHLWQHRHGLHRQDHLDQWRRARPSSTR